MQTPEASPERKKSPISSLTSKSWRNLRSKLPNLSPSPREESRGQFVVLSSSLNSQPESPLPIFSPPKYAPPLIVTASDERSGPEGRAEPAPPLPAAPRLLAESPIPKNSPPNSSINIPRLGEPFEEDGFYSDSDRGSAFSFNRQMSCKYYKEAPEVDVRSSPRSYCGSYASYGSFESYVSNCSYISSGDLFYGGMDSDEQWSEDLSHLEEHDCFSELIAEANEIPSDEELELTDHAFAAGGIRRAKSAPASCGHSMHRQLTISREGSITTFFDDPRPKRTKSTLSTTSVWPILE